jgi:predicted transglutaminase-like cysteine proteinase
VDSRNSNESIVYPPTAKADPFLPGLGLWALFLFAVPLLPLAYYLVLRPRYPEPLSPWTGRLSLAEIYAGLAGVVLFVLAILAMRFLSMGVEDVGEQEAETGSVLLEVTDSTGLQAWDMTLIFGPPLLLVMLLVLGAAGPLELLLCGLIPAAVVLGSRPLPRFPEAKGAVLPYSDEELKKLFEKPEGVPVQVEYRWRFKEHPYLAVSPEKEFKFSIPFTRAHYEAALEKPHAVHDPFDYARFPREDFTSPELVMVAAKLKEIHAEQGYSRFQQVGNVLAFTHQFAYAGDEDTKGAEEYPRYPVEMLWDREGDCECHAILAAALLALLGFDTVLLVLDFEKGPGHVAVGVAGADDLPPDLAFYELGGKRYFYCEPTPPVTGPDGRKHWRWEIGVVPLEDLTRVTPVPLTVTLSR